MARYNTSLASNSISGSTTISSPYNGAFTQLTGTAPYTVTLPEPTLYPGSNQTFYNATSGTVTLLTTSGVFTGTGATNTNSIQVYSGNVISVTSNGTNYIVISEDGSPLIATSGLFSSDVTINGASANVSVTPGGTLTLNPASASTINNMSIGASTRSSGAFTTLAANNQVTFTGNISSSGTSSGTIVVTGGIGVSGNINSGGTIAATALNGPLTGTIQTAAQPNITSLGTLTSLTVSNAGTFNNVLVSNNTINPDNYANQLVLGGISVSGWGVGAGVGGNAGVGKSWGLGHNGTNWYLGMENGSAINTMQTYIQMLPNRNLALVEISGSVGVGTTTPSTKMHLYETAAADVALRLTPSNGSYDALFQLTGQGNDMAQEGFEIWYSNTVGDVHFSTTYPNDAASMHFHTRTGGSKSTTNERLTILGNGNIGINNTSPQAPLSFNTSTGNKIDFYHNTGTSDRYGVQVQSSELRIHSGSGGAGDGGITLGKSSTSSFTEAMRVRNDTTITMGNTTIAGGTPASGSYTHYERTNSPQTITRTNWGKSSSMYPDQGRGTPNYNMPFVVSFYTPNNESNSANTYYPVSFNTPGHGGGQFGNLVICRRYHDTGPAQRGGSGIGWNDSSTHQGGLECWFHVGESAWSDYYSARLMYYRYTYHTTVSDYGMMLTNDSRFGSGPFWVRLRGGFQYWVHSTYPVSPANVLPGGTVFYYPTEGNTYQTWPGTVTSVQNTNFNSNQYWGTL